MHTFTCALWNEAECSFGSEASDPRQLEILKAAVKFMKANWP